MSLAGDARGLAPAGDELKAWFDALPEAPRKAFEDGLKKMVQRVVKWGPRGDETYLDMQAAVAMTTRP